MEKITHKQNENQSALYAQALETREKLGALAALDLALLEMEEKQGLLDGITIEGWML